MNLAATISIYGGGPGSGCNPEVGKCGRPAGSGKGEPWEQSKEEYVGKFKGFASPNEITDEEEKEFDAYRKKDREWESSVKQAISIGKLSPELAVKRGFYAGEAKTFVPLPDNLFHVTVAADKVDKEGLKSRAEQSVHDGAGLGGGEDDTISFTTDPKIADAIFQGIHEARAVARGELTVPDMLSIADAGIGAPKPWGNELRNSRGLFNIDDLLRNVTKTSELAGIPPDVKGTDVPTDYKGPWHPTKDSYHWTDGDGKERFTTWERQLTPDEKIDRAFNFYKAWSMYRESVGGMYDPLFFFNDTKALAATKPENIKIYQLKPVPGAKGVRQSAMGEYRTYSGKAVQVVRSWQPKTEWN